MLLETDQEGLIAEMLKKTSKEQVLPPHLDKKVILNLPNQPGVYYFKDRKGKIIYVGKDKNRKYNDSVKDCVTEIIHYVKSNCIYNKNCNFVFDKNLWKQ